MSLINDASLILTPNAISAGKLYSIIPTNGNGDMTVVRGTNATRINSAGLVEIPRTNLCLRSEEFNDVTWIKTNGATITANSEISPIGILNADLMTATAAFAQVQTTPTVVIGVSYTVSMWIKRISGTGQVYLRSIENVSTPITITNEWVRYSVTTTATTTIGRIGVQLGVSGDSVAVWGAQLETSNVATEYIPTVASIRTSFSGITQDGASASNIARLNYETVGGCPAILIEPQRINLVLRSEEFENPIWVKFNATITPNNVISPSGTLTADKFIPNATASVNKYIYQTPTVSNGINHSITVFAKLAEYNRLRIEQGNNSKGAWFNLSNGTIGTIQSGVTAEIKNIGNGWYSCSINTISTATNVFFLIGGSSSESIQVGDGTSGIYIWGAQLEVGAYATSYIPTLGGIQTRNADGISNTNISPLIGQTEGTFFIDFQNKANEVTTGVVVRVLYTITDGTANNRFSQAIVKTATRNYTDITIRSNNVTVSNINVDTPTGRFKIAVSYKIGATKMFINGVLVGTAGLSEIPIINRLFLGCSTTLGGENANVSINNFLTVKTALTDAECISMTQL